MKSQQVDETTIVSLVDDTELVNQPHEEEKAGTVEPLATTRSGDGSARKHAWIHVALSPDLSSASSIFTFIPAPTLVTPADTPEEKTDRDVEPRRDAEGTEVAAATSALTPTRNAIGNAVAGSHVIQIESVLLDSPNLEVAQALQVEKSYAVPFDIPQLGWFDCFQLGVELAYTAMLLRRNISPRLLSLNEEASIGRLSATQICIIAHSGVAFNECTQSLVTRQVAPVPESNSKQMVKKRKKTHKRGLPQKKTPDKKKTTHWAKDPAKIGDAGAIAVFRALRVNKALVSLTLQHTGLGDVAMCALAAMVRCNSTLTKLDLEGNEIGPLGIQALCDALEDAPDSMLLQLDLSYNRITDEGMPHLCRAFRENETLVWLNLSWNQLTSAALLKFLEALRDNFVLREVSMYGKDCDEDQYCQNHESKFAKQVAVALRCVNDSLAQLRLTSARAYIPVDKVKQSRWVTLPDTDLMEMDALVIAGLLPLNAKLLTLDLSNNKGIERWGVLEVLASIKHCKTLKHLNLANTGLREEAAEPVAELIASNDALETVVMHESPMQVQELRGCHQDVAVETMQIDIPQAHHFDRWILAKCLALNRPTQQLNGIRLPPAPAVTTGGSSKLVSVNLSGRTFDVYEVVFLSKKVFHHLHMGRVALNSCKIESYGGIALADAFRNHATLETLELENNRIGIAGGKAMGECVEYNSSLTYLNLSWNRIGNDGAVGFRRALRSNRSLVRLDLRGNDLGAAGIIAISEGLKGNACLKELYLRWNVICPQGAEALAQALVVNKTLRLLDIEHHTMGEVGAHAFALMLEKNNRLQELNMKGDDSISDGDVQGIGPDQAQRIAVVLTEKNTSLTNLNIAQNQIGKEGVVWFSNLLKFNKTLKVLDLSLSGMDGQIAHRFFECLGMNKALVKLNLAHNRISNEGMMACIKALEVNKVLQDLDLTDNTITEEPLALLIQRLRSPKHAIALKWLCLAGNSMTDRTFQSFWTLQSGTTIVLEEEKHRSQMS